MKRVDDRGATVYYKTSSHCTSGECVGVGRMGDMIIVTNTQPSEFSTIQYTIEEWTAFLAGVKDGEFDLDQFPSHP